MIKARRLFLVPALSAFLIIIPFGIFLYIIICCIWACRNQEELFRYFRGINYNKNEVREEELEDLR